MPSFTSSNRLSNGTSPGNRFRLHMRIIGTNSQLWARTQPLLWRPMARAVSFDVS